MRGLKPMAWISSYIDIHCIYLWVANDNQNQPSCHQHTSLLSLVIGFKSLLSNGNLLGSLNTL